MGFDWIQGVSEPDPPANPDFGDDVPFDVPDHGRGEGLHVTIGQAVDRWSDCRAFGGQQASSLLLENDIQAGNDPPAPGRQDRQHCEPAGQFTEVRQGDRVNRSEVVSDRSPIGERYDRVARLQFLHDRAYRPGIGSPETDEQREQASPTRQRASPLPASEKLCSRPLPTQGEPAVPSGGPSGWISQSGGRMTVLTIEVSFQPWSVFTNWKASCPQWLKPPPM